LTFEFVTPKDAQPRQVRNIRPGSSARTFAAATIASPSPEELAAYAGTFYSEEAEATFKLRVDGGRLQLEGSLGSRQTLRPSIRDEFLNSVGVLQFQRDSAGSVTGFRLNSPRVRKLRFERQAPS